jgi:hypothetical protein
VLDSSAEMRADDRSCADTGLVSESLYYYLYTISLKS